MSTERGDALRGVILDTSWDPHSVARSICEHLGITWEDVDGLSSDLANLRDQVDYGPEGIEVWVGPEQQRIGRVHDALATLLEAAGIER